ncbi:MAG: transaldolase family protein [Treponemataceae bacterium]
MKGDYFHRVARSTPTEFWINNVTRKEAELAVAAGALGCTQNPSYPWKMLNSEGDGEYSKALLDKILISEPDDDMAQTKLQQRLVGNICSYFKPLFDASGGRYGWVSIQNSPYKEDAKHLTEFARFHREAAPNVIAKIPATQSGLEAMRVLIREGVPVLATEVMSIDQADAVGETYVECIAGMKNPAPLKFAHIAGIFDEHLGNTVAAKNIAVDKDALWQAGIAVAKKIHQRVVEKRYPIEMMNGGARGLHHFTELVGYRGSVTINWKGAAETLIENDPPVVQRFQAATPFSVIDELSDKLEVFRKAYCPGSLKLEEFADFGPVVLFRNQFEDAWKKALALIAGRRKELARK